MHAAESHGFGAAVPLRDWCVLCSVVLTVLLISNKIPNKGSQGIDFVSRFQEMLVHCGREGVVRTTQSVGGSFGHHGNSHWPITKQRVLRSELKADISIHPSLLLCCLLALLVQRFCSLPVLSPSHIVPSPYCPLHSWDQVLTHISLWGTFHIKSRQDFVRMF